MKIQTKVISPGQTDSRMDLFVQIDLMMLARGGNPTRNGRTDGWLHMVSNESLV